MASRLRRMVAAIGLPVWVRVWRGGGWLDFGLATLMVWAQFATSVHLGVIAGMVYATFVLPPAVHRVASTRDVRPGLALVESQRRRE